MLIIIYAAIYQLSIAVHSWDDASFTMIDDLIISYNPRILLLEEQGFKLLFHSKDLKPDLSLIVFTLIDKPKSTEESRFNHKGRDLNIEARTLKTKLCHLRL